MPTPEGNITGSEIWQPEPKLEDLDVSNQTEDVYLEARKEIEKEELTEEEKCPCFYGGTCPTGGEHKDDL